MSQTLVKSLSQLSLIGDRIEAAEDILSFDCETNGLHHIKDSVVGFSFCYGNDSFYVPVLHKKGNISDSWNDIFHAVKGFLGKISKKKIIFHNSLFDTSMVYRTFNVILPVWHDTMIMAYVINEDSYGLKELSKKYFQDSSGEYQELLEMTYGKQWKKQNLNFSDLDPEICLDYASRDAYFTFHLLDMLKPKMDEYGAEGVYNLELRLMPIVRKMNFTGITIDVELLQSAAARMRELNDARQKSIWEIAGKEFSINSPKEAAAVVFGDFGLPVIKRSEKTQLPSLDKEVLETLSASHPIIPLISKWRSDSRLVVAYAEKIPMAIESDGKIYTHFKAVGAVSGRLTSSSDVAHDGEEYGCNFQNISKKDLEVLDNVIYKLPAGITAADVYGLSEEEVKAKGCISSNEREEGAQVISIFRDADVRSAFIAPEGFTWLKADYNQIEYRVMASLANEQTLVNQFKAGVDFHTATAAFMLGKETSAVTKHDRQKGKIFNFGLSYGMSVFSLAKRTGMSEEEATEKYEAYFAAVPKLAELIANARAFAEKNGYTRTLFGRRRFLDIKGLPGNIVSKILRKSFNTLVQGTAADILKIAMIRVSKAIKPYGRDVQLLLTVHDELCLIIKNELLSTVAPIIKSAMELPVPENWAPIEVSIEIGKSWSSKDLKEYKCESVKQPFVSWKNTLES